MDAVRRELEIMVTKLQAAIRRMLAIMHLPDRGIMIMRGQSPWPELLERMLRMEETVDDYRNYKVYARRRLLPY